MHAWPTPYLPELPEPTTSRAPIRIHDAASDQLQVAAPGSTAGIYVCGITPYDAAHLGHAATYVGFDLLNRAWRDAGRSVTYVQNVTDVDDPLLERATATGVHWWDLAQEQIALFSEDMAAIGVIPPDYFLGVVETIDWVVDAVEQLMAAGAAYRVGEEGDVYADLTASQNFGEVSHLRREEMLALFGERGGDPLREGKRDALDPLLWRGERDGEPSWDGRTLGRGRPGWHIECAVIAQRTMGLPFDVQAGGSDLIFPHHEMGAAHGELLASAPSFAHRYAYAGMVGYQGEKMSKSKGNLVFVSQLRRDGVDPMAIRLALIAHHYASDWEWTDKDLIQAQERLARWRGALAREGGEGGAEVLQEIREALANDLDAPAAVAAVDRWAARQLSAPGRSVEDAAATVGEPGVVGRAVDALLGVRL